MLYRRACRCVGAEGACSLLDRCASCGVAAVMCSHRYYVLCSLFVRAALQAKASTISFQVSTSISDSPPSKSNSHLPFPTVAGLLLLSLLLNVVALLIHC
ncbi:hypothetical protein Dimus_013840 [Dionaea muscipula]